MNVPDGVTIAARTRRATHSADFRNAKAGVASPVAGVSGRRPRILMLVQLPPPLHGASAINRQIVDSKMLGTRVDMRVVPISMGEDLTAIRKFSLAKIAKSFSCLFQIAAQLQRGLGPDLVYFTLSPNGWAFYRDLIFVALVRLSEKRHVFHLHGRGIADAMRSAPWRRALYRFAFARAYVITLANSLGDELKGLVPLDRIFVVPNGIRDVASLHKFTQCASNASSPAARHPRVIFLSNMLEQKGPLVLLEALGLLARKGLQFDAQFAGAWRDVMTPERFAAKLYELGLDDRVTHLGVVTGQAKEQLFADADIFAFPTYYEHEAFPLVVIEAMMHGLAIVTTNVGALPEMISHGSSGELIAPNDVAQLADAIERLLESPELRKRYGRAARASYEAGLTDRRFEQRLSEVLLHLAERPRADAGR